MRKLRLIILTLYWTSAFTWKFLPAVWGLIGYLLFAPPVWLGIVMGALLAFAGHLTKRVTGFILRRPDSHGSARFADLDDVQRGRLLRQKGQILGRKAGRILRYSGDGHLLTIAPTRSGKGAGCVIPNLLSHQGLVVVTDIKGENSAIAGACRRRIAPVY
ncbi:MAG: type IV secretory system conjugative DNA transfer family protein [Pseudohongiellaceae bacterium]